MKKFVIIPIFLGLSLTGCGQYKVSQELQAVNEGTLKVADRPWCEVKAAEYALETKVIALEITSSNGISMGFDLISKFLNLLKLSFTTKSGRLALALGLYDPLKPQYGLMSVIGESKLKENEFKFDLGLQKIGIGFESYYKTPMSSLFERGLEDSFSRLDRELSIFQDEWTTTVVALPTPYDVVVPVGSFSGLKVGDTFELFNVEHVWDGVPCESEHLIARKTSGQPLAMAVLTQLDKSAAVLSVMSEYRATMAEPIKVGARVEVARKASPETRVYTRSLEIAEINGADLDYENGQKISLQRFVGDQIEAVARRHGYSIFRRR